MNLTKRVDALEERTGANLRPWHRIMVNGQTEAEAIAAYEAEHGSTVGDNLILPVIVDPPARAGAC